MTYNICLELTYLSKDIGLYFVAEQIFKQCSHIYRNVASSNSEKRKKGEQ